MVQNPIKSSEAESERRNGKLRFLGDFCYAMPYSTISKYRIISIVDTTFPISFFAEKASLSSYKFAERELCLQYQSALSS